MLNSMKFYMSIKVVMQKAIHGNTDIGNFRTSATIITQSTNMEDLVQQHMEILNNKMDEFVRNGECYNQTIVSA